jgi:hypothetical protein
MLVRVFLREGCTQIDLHALEDGTPPTVKDLHEHVLTALSQTPVDRGMFGASVCLHAASILVFKNGDATPLDGSVPLDATQMYTALEKFVVTPIDLFRLVEPSKLHPAVASTNPNALSSHASLLCAAFKEEEYPANPFDASGANGSIKSHGVSLNCGSGTTTFHKDSNSLPWQDILSNEQQGEFGVDVVSNFTAHPSSFGYLAPAEIYNPAPFPSFVVPQTNMLPLKDTQKRSGADGKNRDKTKMFTRSNYFRFKLPSSTELEQYGVYVVYDRANHFSLICAHQRSPTNNRWVRKDQTYELVNPGTSIIVPEPECLGPVMYGTQIMCTVALPTIAALFQLQDFLIKAAAVPSDLRYSQNDSNKDLKAVVPLLY